MIFDLTMEQYQERLREAVELATDRNTRSWRMFEVMQELLSLLGQDELPPKFCKGCGTTDLPPRRSSWCGEECQLNFYRKFQWQNLQYKIMDRNCCEICGRDRSIPIPDLKIGYHREYDQFVVCDYLSVDRTSGYYNIWQVHHINPINANGGGGKIFDPDNLALLCIPCHGMAHRELNDLHRPSPEEKVRSQGYTLLDDYGGVK